VKYGKIAGAHLEKYIPVDMPRTLDKLKTYLPVDTSQIYTGRWKYIPVDSPIYR
jgi:hypothetical protein